MAVCQEYIVAVLEGADDGCIVRSGSWLLYQECLMAVLEGIYGGCIGRSGL